MEMFVSLRTCLTKYPSLVFDRFRFRCHFPAIEPLNQALVSNLATASGSGCFKHRRESTLLQTISLEQQSAKLQCPEREEITKWIDKQSREFKPRRSTTTAVPIRLRLTGEDGNSISQGNGLQLMKTDEVMVTMEEVIKKFSVVSVVMWVVPAAIVYAFQLNLFPGLVDMSPYTKTLISGFLAVIEVNVLVAVYIYMAMKQPSDKHQPDPAFLANAKSSFNQTKPVEEADGSSHDKE
ncbi:hypothetical protein AKJ16_DCAP17242 [Drosera capensis]